MPRRDGTGPAGMGAMTGRGMGICAGNRSQGFGYGRGMGYGRGNGFGNGAQLRADNNVVPIQQDELSVLKNQANMLENALNNVKERISELEQK